MKNGEKENEQEKENHIKQREKTQNVQSFQKKEQEDMVEKNEAHLMGEPLIISQEI